MPTKQLTDLRPDRRIPGNLIVEINGARFSSLPADVVAGLALKTGEVVSQERFEKLSRIADVEGAYRVALRMLAASPRSVNELLRRIRDRGHNPSAVAEAVGRLEAKGLVDNHEFARHFARVRLGRGHAPPRILTDLLSRGVERRLAERSIDESLHAEGVDTTGAARALAEKRLAQLGNLPKSTLRRRVMGYLVRRGYRGYEIRELVEEIVGQQGVGSRE